MTTLAVKIQLPMEELADFCRRWKIARLAVFGSAVRDDFVESSDLDLLATFEPNPGWSLFDHVAMEEELAAMVGRRVDLIGRHAVETSCNGLLRKRILESARIVYEAR